jgi:biopolymer transport protein ExbD
MKRVFRILILAAALAACTGERGAGVSPSTDISIGYQPPNTCLITVGGRTYNLATELEAADAALKRELGSHPDAHLKADTNVPYKCMGGVILTAQRAGFKRIAFISQPPPAEGKQ